MGLANVNTPTIPSLSPSMDFTLARSGDNFTAYVSFGGAYVNVYTLTGPAISEPVLIDIGAFGEPGLDISETTTFHDLVVINSVSPDVVGLTGGTVDNPIPLPAIPINTISGNIGDGFPNSDFYSFYWNGGAFAVSVGVPDASILTSPPSYLFQLCNGTTCNDVLQQTVADVDNDWAQRAKRRFGRGLLHGWNHRARVGGGSRLRLPVRNAAVTNRKCPRAFDVGDDAAWLCGPRLCGLSQN